MYLDCCYTEYLVKETASLHLKLPLKVIFLETCLDNVFGKDCYLFTLYLFPDI